jgi:hypothetical protein
MAINIDEKNLKHGILGLVIALVEVIKDTLKIQALKRMESGRLTDEECERLGKALLDLDAALEEIKIEQGISESVQAVRDGLDDIVDSVINGMINPERWPEPNCHSEGGTTEESRWGADIEAARLHPDILRVRSG